MGRTIGYPTANLKIEEEKKLVPGNGVYAVTVQLYENISETDGTQTPLSAVELKGMMNIGVRPTVEGVNRMIEVNIFDFDQEIYGSILTIHIKKRLRSEQKFNGLEELKNQLAKDKRKAEEW